MPAKKVALWVIALVAVGAAVWYRSKVFNEPAPAAVRIALITCGRGPFWQLVSNGARAAAATNNVSLDIKSPEDTENVAQQTKILEQLDVKAFDGVAVSPLDVEGQTPIIDRIAKQALVVTYDSDAPKSARISYVGTSNIQAGRRAARLVQEAAPKGGKVAVFVANLTKDNLIERREGFDEAIKSPAPSATGEAPTGTYEVIDYFVDEGSKDACREKVKKVLDEHTDVACLVGLNAFHGPILLEVLKAKDKLGKVAVVTFDEEPDTLAGVEAGTIHATVVQDPYRYGYETVKSLAAFCRGTDRDRPLKGSFSTLSIATMTVDKDTLGDFRKQLEERLGPGEGTTR